MRLMLLAVLLALGGCSVAMATSSAVSGYCAVPNPARLANRILVNATIAPHRITVTCADEVADE